MEPKWKGLGKKHAYWPLSGDQKVCGYLCLECAAWFGLRSCSLGHFLLDTWHWETLRQRWLVLFHIGSWICLAKMFSALRLSGTFIVNCSWLNAQRTHCTFYREKSSTTQTLYTLHVQTPHNSPSISIIWLLYTYVRTRGDSNRCIWNHFLNVNSKKKLYDTSMYPWAPNVVHKQYS